MRGLLITFEGIDFCGKSVQSEALYERIRSKLAGGGGSREIFLLREPGDTVISEKIRDLLLDRSVINMNPISEVLLYSAARSQLIAEKIKPNLELGHVIICDRFYDSTTAYQGYGRQIDLDVVRMANKIATHGIVPDVTFILDLDIQDAAKRRKAANLTRDRIEIENGDFYTRVRDGYLELANEEKDRIILLNANDGVENISNKIWTLVEERLET